MGEEDLFVMSSTLADWRRALAAMMLSAYSGNRL